MLKPDVGRQQLEKLKSSKHAEARWARIRKLPEALAAPAFGLNGRLPSGDIPKDWNKRRELQQATIPKLADAKARAKIFAALFPTIASEIEAGWQLLLRLPYTSGYNRRGFRAPGRPGLYADRQQRYLESLDCLTHFPDDMLSADWLAAWTVHLSWCPDNLGYLFAGVIDDGGPAAESVLSILKDSMANRHEIGGPGAHATRGLLCCGRPDAWEFVEKTLLAAQRQEGLRQVILEAVDEAHPQAFPRMVRLMLEHNLIRFASAARAVGVWLGDVQVVENPKKLKSDLESVRDMLADPAARQKAIAKGNAASAYRGLWAIAFEDAAAAVKAATPLFKDKDPTRRFAAAKLAAETGLSEAAPLMLSLLDDPDLRLVSLGLTYAAVLARITDAESEEAGAKQPADLFERVAKVIPKLPEKPKELKAPVESWYVASIGQQNAADILIGCLGKRPAEKLLPYLPMMSPYARVQSLAKLCEPRTLTTKVRQTLLAIAGEPNRYVREAALKHLKQSTLAEDEVQTLEGYLTRKAPDFRRSVFELLLNRPDKLMLGTIDRLLAAGDANSRGAGIELARRMVDDERSAEVVREKLRAYRDEKGKRLAQAEADAIEIAVNPAARLPTLDDGLGTHDPADRSPIVAPTFHEVRFATPAAVAFVRELDAFIHENRDKTYVDRRYQNRTEEKVLGSVRWYWEFPEPDAKKPIAEDRQNLPLLELWEDWWISRSPETRDEDGLELLRAAMLPTQAVREGEEIADDDDEDEETSKNTDAEVAAALEQLMPLGVVRVRYQSIINRMFGWFQRLYPAAGGPDFVLDAAESALALAPPSLLEKTPRAEQDEIEPERNEKDESIVEWRDMAPFNCWIRKAQRMREMPGWTGEHTARLFRLCRWLDEPVPGARRQRPDLDIVLSAYAAGAATLADFGDHLIGPRAKQRYSREAFEALRQLTPGENELFPLVDERPELRAKVDEVVARIIEIELARGETPTAATSAAHAIKRVTGVNTLFDLVAGLGKTGFTKSPAWGESLNKPAVLTALIQQSVPLPEEMPEKFAAAATAAIKEGRFELERIAELGLVNPRWVRHVAGAVKWPGYEEAVYWFIAHTRNRWEVTLSEEGKHDNGAAAKKRAAEKAEDGWQTIVKARTNLTVEQRADGLIDVAWFHQAYAAVGSDKRWDAIETAAKFLGFGQGHKKAARLADVLLGRTKKKDLVAEIRKKTLKESVRLLGLLPLPTEAAKKEVELAERYRVLKEYERYARGLSALSKEPAMQAARLGLENLAVTAGYADPIRLEWAVTASEVADLAKGPATVSLKDVSISLTLTALSDPELTQTKAGQPLKSIPADVKKNAKVIELFERKKNLARIATNTKRSLEQAMCAGDRFRGAELKALMSHGMVRPLLDRLVLKSAAGMGYPRPGRSGAVELRNWAGKSFPVKAGDEWSIAHPLEFAAAGDWHEWQGECFKAERLQPFKQVFREVYVLTPAEKEDGDRSRRYSGQQVNENQAKALFATRGWSTREEISKLYRDANLVVHVLLDESFGTPADAAAPAVGEAVFHSRIDWKRLPLKDVPKTIFSEVMRDLDLVVSVAHIGGVDPEATQSTVEMRADLLRETCKLLKMENIKLESRHALIQGEYGRYSVHLGSGVVHKQPGGALCVVPVNAQHRGRLFLPFADDDPRTAEVVSKVLLLARDKEIQDPTILQQIVAQ